MHRPFLTSLLAFLLTLPLASFSQPLNETSCTPKDLRDARLGPIRDTKNMNWSYAVASADLLTHHMNLAVGQRVSAEALALELQTTHPLQNFTDSMSDLRFFTQMMDAQGKVTAKNNTAARTLGHHQNPDKYLCLESEVGSPGYEGADLTEVFDLIDDAATLYRGKKSENFDCNSEYGQAIHQLFPTLALDEITLALAQSSWNSTRNFVDLKDKSCKTRLNFPEGLTKFRVLFQLL